MQNYNIINKNILSESTKQTITELSRKKQHCPSSLINITDKSYNEKLSENKIEKKYPRINPKEYKENTENKENKENDIKENKILIFKKKPSFNDKVTCIPNFLIDYEDEIEEIQESKNRRNFKSIKGRQNTPFKQIKKNKKFYNDNDNDNDIDNDIDKYNYNRKDHLENLSDFETKFKSNKNSTKRKKLFNFETCLRSNDNDYHSEENSYIKEIKDVSEIKSNSCIKEKKEKKEKEEKEELNNIENIPKSRLKLDEKNTKENFKEKSKENFNEKSNEEINKIITNKITEYNDDIKIITDNNINITNSETKKKQNENQVIKLSSKYNSKEFFTQKKSKKEPVEKKDEEKLPKEIKSILKKTKTCKKEKEKEEYFIITKNIQGKDELKEIKIETKISKSKSIKEIDMNINKDYDKNI
jgi:hypothetical protein